MMAPESPPDPIQVARSFTALLDRLGVTHLLGGSLASSVHGEPRSTNDVDILAEVREEHVSQLVEALRPDYYVSEEAVRAAVREGRSFNVIHMDAAVKVDVFVAGSDPFDAERLRCRELVRWSSEPGGDLFVDRAEHSVLRKLEWYRRGGEVSERQWRDVLGILRIQGEALDPARLDVWAERLGISDLLREATRQAGGGS